MKISKLSRCAAVSLTAFCAISCDKVHTAYGLTSDGQILKFNTGSTSTSSNPISSSVTVSGLASGESLVQIAYRPATSSYYGVTNDNRLFTLDIGTGAAAAVGASVFATDTLGNVSAAFDPVNDQLRIIATSSASATGYEDLRVDPDNGEQINDADTLVYTNAQGGNPQINGLMYTDPVAGTGSTTLYGLDTAGEQLVQIGDTLVSSPTDVDQGQVQPIGPLGLAFTATLGFAVAPQDGIIYAALSTAGSGASLYSINSGTGGATYLGTIGAGDYTVISLVISP